MPLPFVLSPVVASRHKYVVQMWSTTATTLGSALAESRGRAAREQL